VGFISNKEVEDPAIALERLKKVSKIVGPENISFVHPDCGLLLAKPEDVEQILANMETASDSFFESLSQSIA
jgi:methionine synthase II (cobalamin-independent)